MENNNKKLEEIKQLIQCFLIPYKNGLRLKSLSNRFKNEIGFKIPFRELGFDSLLDLLKEIKECVGIRVQDNHENESDFIVFALSDERIQHIQQFVDQQKSDNNIVLNPKYDNYVQRRLNNRDTVYKPYSLENDLNSQLSVLNIGSNHRRVTQRQAVCPLPYNRVIPVRERLRIKQLMEVYYEGMNLYNFPSLYKLTHKEFPQYQRYGFQTLEEFLMDLKDLVQLINYENCVQVIPINAYQNASIHSNKDINSTKENANIHINNGFIKEKVIQNNKPLNESQKETQNADKSLKNGYNKIIENSSSNTINEENKTMIPTKELEKFRKILRMNSEGMVANKFSEEYYRLFKVPLIVSKWGFGSPLEMFCSLENIFHLQKPENLQKDMDEWTLIETNPMIRAAKSQQKRQFKKRFDLEFKNRVLFIVKRISESVPNTKFFATDFPDAYYLAFGEDFDLNKFGYNSLKELFIDLSKVIDIDVKEKSKNETYLIYKVKGY